VHEPDGGYHVETGALQVHNFRDEVGVIDALYILSSGRSGSTLLNLMLGAHRDAVALSEIKQLPRDIADRNLCSCGREVSQCEHWRAFAEEVRARMGIDLWNRPYDLQLGALCDPRRTNRPPVTHSYLRLWKLRHALVYASEAGAPVPAIMRRAFDRGIDNTRTIYDIARKVSGARVVVDASKSYLRGLALHRRDPERTRLVLLSRNGRASFYSRLRDGYDRSSSLRAWRNYYRHALPLLQRHVPSEHVLRVKYEQLVADPGGQMKRLCAFAGLPFDAAMLDLKARTQHITSGNDMRLRTDGRIAADTAWQTALAPADERFFEQWAGGLNRRLGYE
jgi:hypothetical protein